MNQQPDETDLLENPHPVMGNRLNLWDKLGGRSLTIAVILHLIVLVLGAFWIFQIIHEPETTEANGDYMPPGGGGEARGAQHQIHQRQRNQIVPASNARRVVALDAHAPIALPEQTEQFSDMPLLTSMSASGASAGMGGSGSGRGFGNGSGTGIGHGSGHGTGTVFGPVPQSMRKRCDMSDRLKRIADTGGTPACEDAVLKGLQWLKANQNPDGSWNGQSRVAMTGLALLAYFGHCETPVSDEFGDSCLKAIIYLVGVGMKNDGKLADNFNQQSWSYEHGIATYALGEALTFCMQIGQDVPYLAEVTGKACQFIIDNQNANGGWAYSYAVTGGHTDMSVVGWQIQALKACSHTGIKFKGRNACLSKAFKYIAYCQNAGGGYGYTGPDSRNGDYFTLTGVGMLCNQMWDKGNGQDVSKAARYVAANTKFDFKNKADLYAHYYESQAMMQRGGDDWKMYNALFRDQLLNNQAADGSWKPTGSPHVNNDVFSTCLCTLMLEVYYRFLKTSGGDQNIGI